MREQRSSRLIATSSERVRLAGAAIVAPVSNYCVIYKRADGFSSADLKVFPKLALREQYAAQVRQQGEYLSLHRDMIIGFGNWEFSPLELDNPFPNNEGSVHLWHGTEDTIVPFSLSRYISQKLSWIQFHEVPDAGHMFPLADGMSDVIVEALLLGKK
ncbi:hypothetical protein ZIOFF_024519 [Zingiber officinale]|uniref:Uncharacterized protein n=1 Tax=Zingiber officinale TaxID=94328 RepID=A0A8J5GTQ1_ZINOF|nr:hypothetical protein ZIOFF_024519 [Zingiber officinale]